MTSHCLAAINPEMTNDLASTQGYLLVVSAGVDGLHLPRGGRALLSIFLSLWDHH